MQKNFTLVKTNLRRILALQPGVRSLRGTVADSNDDSNSTRAAETASQTLFVARAQQASLSPNPKNVYELWQEYEVGSGGRNAAILFSRINRGGKNKHKYRRRNVLVERSQKHKSQNVSTQIGQKSRTRKKS
jgi:hypothetical protein